ncbi:Crp/Fnr family transcriptional regulator [Taibaiella chishuiensis]|uniref:CRP-like cAMP-binding protein n=1 Tax=Taibaiella chishuiensis TaxID=1434707 RepID=A0A2P8CXU7_9BACT|nr:Crp/Fnr family transcriptional regulator [Taibaiella chishuiensis]PSK89756.1 CRP-like cAMP-binding protein [Taibaiella chishuiensis]
MYEPLLRHIRNYIRLDASEEAVLQGYLQTAVIGKKEHLLKEGQVCNASYFVAEGCLRQYYRKDNGTEQTIQFAIENWWMSDYISLEQQKPSAFCMQAVEQSTLVYIPYSAQAALFEALPAMERYFRLVLQRAYMAALTRIQYIFTFTGEERYHHFQQSFPGFVQRIPQYMLASYLGFTPEFLSKIRAKR